MSLNAWKEGSGAYIDDARTTFVVKGPDGKAFLAMIEGGVVGSGQYQHRIARQDGRLVVEGIRHDNETSPRIVLADTMTGYWELSGQHVFSPTNPVHAVVRPATEQPRNKKKAVAEEPAQAATATEKVLPSQATAVLRDIRARYTVWRGTGGITLLINKGGEFFTPDTVGSEFRGFLTSEWRALLLRTLRRADGVRDMAEVPVHRYSRDGYVTGVSLEEPGWYWREPGKKQEFICARTQAARLTITAQQPDAWDMAVNNSNALPLALLGFVTSAEYVFPRARSNNDFELLVLCPLAAAREFTVLLSTTDGGLRLLSFRVERSSRGVVSFDTVGRERHVPPFIVLNDNKGRGRVFRRP